ncbi:MAG: hypothetical protein K1X33_08660 [Methanobacteriaceae archaeon]|nr:hypothetical protein [Methanobacteriaceae archaeon]
MQIRKISDKVHKEFPDLQHISPTDFYQVWKSYESELTDYLLNPTLPYVQFLNVGIGYVKFEDFRKNMTAIKKTLKFLDTAKIKNVDYNKLKNKTVRFKNLIEKKQEFYKKFLIYLDGWDTDDIPFYNRMIEKLQVYIDDVNKIIEEYDKRLITRDLEK